MKSLHTVSFILLVIGGLNWLLFAFHYDVGTWVSASWWGTVMMIVYILVGLSALYEVFTHKGRCKECSADAGAMPSQKM